jgi:hypothetical protein
MTTRRWMIAVAVAALAMGAIAGVLRLGQWRDYFEWRTILHMVVESDCQANERIVRDAIREINVVIDQAEERERKAGCNGHDISASARSRKAHLKEQAAVHARRAAYHAAMAAKYRRAARPWLPVEPDPPAPE